MRSSPSRNAQRGLKVHVGRSHKVQQAAEILREDLEESLNLSEQSDEREEGISFVNAAASVRCAFFEQCMECYGLSCTKKACSKREPKEVILQGFLG